jgi:A118 family predicted phage portal protein
MFLSDVWNRVKETIGKMLGAKTIEQVLGIKSGISQEMEAAIELWSKMYENRAPWLKEPTKDDPVRITSLGLPSLIASEKARMATLEMEVEINAPMEEIEEPNPDYVPPGVDENGMPTLGQGSMIIKKNVPKGNTQRADFLSDQFEKVKKQIRRQLEYGIAKGGLVIKPYLVQDSDFKSSDSSAKNSVDDKSIDKMKTDAKMSANDVKSNDSSEKNKKDYHAQLEFEYIQADGFYPLAFNASGKMTEAAFIQKKIDKDVTYSRIEYHKLEGKRCTVINLAFKSNKLLKGLQPGTETDLGIEIPLTDVPEWSSLQKKTIIDGVDRLLFAYFKMPEANIIDTYSPLGVSGYSRVVNLIKDADTQYSRLLWEFEGGELAIDVDRDALKLVMDENGNDRTERPVAQERLFRKVDLNAEDTYNVFSPALRDDSLLNGLNAILTRIEDCIGMSRGTVSNTPYNEAKTATELKILRQRSYSTNADIQEALEDTLKDVVYIMDILCSLYKVTPEGEYECSFEWDDSILVDIETELSKRLTLMQSGLSSKLETRMWYFNETENQAKAALQKVDDEAKQAIATNMAAQQQMGEEAQQQAPGTFKPENLSNPLTGVKATNEQKAKQFTKDKGENTEE